jgi:hypothetical protein
MKGGAFYHIYKLNIIVRMERELDKSQMAMHSYKLAGG